MAADADLNWLLPAPEDFSAQAKTLRVQAGDPADALLRLAGFALDSDQLLKLARLLDRARTARQPLTGLAPFRLGIISNATTDFIVPAIVGTGLRFGFAIECVTGEYGQVMQAALDPGSVVNAARCDAVLLALDEHNYPFGTAPGDTAAAQTVLDGVLAQIDALTQALGAHCPAVIVQTAPPAPETLLGNFDAGLAGSQLSQTAALNRALIDRSAASSTTLFDVGTLAAQVGLSAWHDPAAWNLAKQPFAHRFIPLYADALCRLIAAIRGKSRKVLVLDLDNTLWAGVIGDDGMAGINLAQGDPTGEAHLALQRYALALRQRGIVLAVCSKNTDDVARQVFREHPDMLLREEHIAVFQANWQDKASNLEAIATALNVGLDALVFVDDNPAERELVRQKLPQVAVPELPDDPAWFVRTIAAAGYFEAVGFSSEDRSRADAYVGNAQRAALQAGSGNIDDYLRSLQMTIRFAPFDAAGQARIAQLINKSNQFNLTTRRYSEAEVAALSNDESVVTLQVRLADTFGDNGMISAVICRTAGADWEIDSWLMSCRVLGRKVEQVVLGQLAKMARTKGVKCLIGSYRPSGRNSIVADHYAKLGFALASEDADHNQTWVMVVDEAGIDGAAALFTAVITD